jgi:hypothetical protein
VFLFLFPLVCDFFSSIFSTGLLRPSVSVLRRKEGGTSQEERKARLRR